MTDKFEQETYSDSETGGSLPYNIFLPDDYDSSKTYPVVLYIADSSLVGQDVTAPLSQYGALIWASDEQQAVQESIVVVPEYPEVILDDHGSYTTTDSVEMTARLLASIEDEYSVDTDRVYGTGQSMGAMTVMYLAAEHPDLFAAEMIVSGQWDPSTLDGLADENFVYFAAGGDENASGGQTDVQAILKDADVGYGTASVDATWSSEEIESTVSDLLASGDSANFATFTTGSVLEVSGASSSSSMGGSSEHMASFQPAYQIAAARDWLLTQTA
ncbi:alpha/beta hydrolase-fold protein [Curtobacterium sp. VKM Ac-1376]|uniref:carboxylesterase family protein n=1 Tax=Curtobacterium sp. VKM Ac-1376 TaxID=123312 RepID=UPI00188DA00A|nr:alpha/beta hydrolase-fold protein [Curtobacterium sp. VKM Ac-1376]MBF4615703.1 prolyl oligopeptidase family serine peptidase [Curtobacterium sp. VKM Ac-1376]